MSATDGGRRLKILLVSGQWRHMGAHSGLAPLQRRLADLADVETVVPTRADRALAAGRSGTAIVRSRLGFGGAPASPFHTGAGAALARAAERAGARGAFDCVLFLSLEEHFEDYRPRGGGGSMKVVAISHQPPGWWRLFADASSFAGRLDGVLALSRPAAAFLAGAFPATRVSLVHHGVDGAHFKPPPDRPAPPAGGGDILVAGQWLRDFAALERIARKLVVARPELRFHMVVPRFARSMDAHYRLAALDNVAWYAGLDDAALAALYRECHLLLMPLVDATANNAILEAMAAGLPIVTNPVGGIPDYLDDGTAALFDTGDDEGAVRATLGALEDWPASMARATAARRRVDDDLDWSVAATRVVSAIRDIAWLERRGEGDGR